MRSSVTQRHNIKEISDTDCPSMDVDAAAHQSMGETIKAPAPAIDPIAQVTPQAQPGQETADTPGRFTWDIKDSLLHFYEP